MSQPPTNIHSIFQTIFDATLKEYEKLTGENLLVHPLAAHLQSYNSPSDILAAIQDYVKGSNRSWGDDERLSKRLKPTINVLCAFSATLSKGSTLPFSPAKTVSTGVGILLLEAKDTKANQEAVVDIFERIGNFFLRLEIYVAVPPTGVMTELIVKIVVEVLDILAIVTKEIKQSRMKKYLKTLVGRMDIQDAMTRLDKLTQEHTRMSIAQALRVGRGADEEVTNVGNKMKDGDGSVDVVANDMKETKAIVQQIANSVDDVKRNQLMTSLRKWVSPPDPSTNHNMASDYHYQGTARWFVQVRDSIFWDWKFTTGSLLWIHGKPGSGKTIICSAIINDIMVLCEAGLASMAYFYFDFRDLGKQDFRGLLASLLIQLSTRYYPFFEILSRLYLGHDDGLQMPSDGALTQCLEDMLTAPNERPIYIILDGPDECPNSGIPSPRQQVLALLKQIVHLRLPHLHICVTSRPEPDIQDALVPLALHRVSLHDEDGQKQDIVNYINSVVYSDRMMMKWRDDDKKLVVETLSEMADGRFRWAFVQLEMLRRCLPPTLPSILQELSKSPDNTYERILMGVKTENRAHAHRLLQCLLVAIGPLSVDELGELLAFEFDAAKGGIPKLNADRRREDPEQAVLSACPGLITAAGTGSSRVVRFSQPSVKEFLTSNRLETSEGDISYYHIIPEDAHMTLAQACLGVLLYRPVDTKSSPLAQYAATHWVTHAQVGEVASHVRDGMVSLFDPDEPYFSAWVKLHDIDNTDYRGRMRNKIQRGAVPLYYAALCGFLELVDHLTQKYPQYANVICGGCGTALHVASLSGHVEVLRLLLQRKAGVDVRGFSNRTPLHFASIGGNLDVVRYLLANDADPNSQTSDHNSPLHYAAEYGNADVVQMLLEHKADTNSQDNYGRTPLHSASSRYHIPKGNYPRVVRLLLERGANPDALDMFQQTPLNGVPSSKLEVARILLEHGADVNVEDKWGSTPLQVALAKGHDEVARLLSG